MALPLEQSSADPPPLLDLAGWVALGEFERLRLELVEGVLQVAAAPERVHQRMARRLAGILTGGLPETWAVECDVDMIVAHDDGHGGPWPTIRRPDVTVFPEDRGVDHDILDPAEVLLAVEVLSPGSRRTDRIAKLADRAEAGIRHYLLVEPGPPIMITAHDLAEGTYHPVATATDPDALVPAVDGARIAVGPGSLTRRRTGLGGGRRNSQDRPEPGTPSRRRPPCPSRSPRSRPRSRPRSGSSRAARSPTARPASG